MIDTNERDEFLITMYHADHTRFCGFCTEEDCDRVDYLNDNLTDKQISKLIENYNLRTFGVTHAQCERRECLLCRDFDRCEKRRENV
ncbi:MAG: hypothetical protein LBL65_05690 [Campylobacteraceae bacterium]|jgi:hypothetical protein|nr:hypothetical protein [Campylobacteraceae bacterium]